ncbi:MAG: hypothetical protein FJ000_02980 [Actinobacteria bacterium]|nr:hypothetical protein [Actinomycetota bacterium]
MAPDDLYVASRRALLDALETLGEQRESLVLIGAQAVYLHAPDDDLAVAPTTTDADLGLDPNLLADSPLLGERLLAADFKPTKEPGIWMSRHGATVDLIVPESLAGSGRRGARLGVHGSKAARRAAGIEGCLVDKAPMTISALDADHGARAFSLAVAGPAALIVSKTHKIADRRDEARGRLRDKDALDVYRLLRAVEPAAFSDGFERLLASDLAAESTISAVRDFEALFADPAGVGLDMTVRATETLIPEVEVRAALPLLARGLLRAAGVAA